MERRSNQVISTDIIKNNFYKSFLYLIQRSLTNLSDTDITLILPFPIYKNETFEHLHLEK